MRRRSLSLAVVVSAVMFGVRGAEAAVTVAPLGGDSAAAGPMPTIADARADLDNGRSTWCIQKIDRLLGTKPEPSPSEKYALLSLKGECMLQQREASLAAQAFNDASKAATDPVEIGTGRATAVLVQRSNDYHYTPVTGKDHHPLPIEDKKYRHAALVALWQDELFKTKPKVDTALKSEDTQSSVDVVPHVHDLANFELAATSASTTCDEMIKSLQNHTEQILAGQVAQWNTFADNVNISAMVMVQVAATPDMPAHSQRKGMSGEEKAKVSDMIVAIGKLGPEVQKLSTAMGAEPSLYAPDLAASDVLLKRLHNMQLGVFRPVRPTTRPAPKTH